MRWERMSVPTILAVGPNSFNANRLIISSLPLDFPDPGIELGSPALQADSLPSEPLGKPLYLLRYIYSRYFILFDVMVK